MTRLLTTPLHALFNAPDIFGNIIAASPLCDEACEDMENTYSENHEVLPARLFVSVGGLEEDYIPGFERLSEALKVSDYDELDHELVILDGETHMSTWPRAFTMGMKMVFAEWDGSYRYDP